MKTGGILLATMASILASGAARADHRIEVSGGMGYDGNPFELSDLIGPREAFFLEGEATVSAEGEAVSGWIKRADIGFTGRIFERDDHEADIARFHVRARGGTREKDTQHGWDLSVRSLARDQTYVSRLTGVEATDDLGNPIGDRYDSVTGEIEGEWRFPATRLGRASVGVAGTYKNYWYDYRALGLDRLDYYEFGVMPGFEFGRRANRFRLRGTLQQRDYFNRRVSDALGAPVAGTDLRYRYYGADLRVEHRFSDRGVFEVTADYELREDNGAGFGDRTQWSVGGEWSWRYDGGSRLRLDATYRSRILDNQATGDTTVNDEAPEKKGFEFAVRYTRPFPFLDIEGFSLFAEAGYEDYTNNDDPRFVYDRIVGLVGVRQEF